MDFSKSINIQERLANNAVVGSDGEMRGFKASEFVQVINIDDEPYKWEQCTEEDIQVDGTGLQSYRTSKIEKFSMESGATQELPGHIAMLFIEGLVKKCIQKAGQTKMTNIPSIQDEWINRIFLGKKGIALPYASVDPETGTRTFKTPEMDNPVEVPFPQVDTSSLEDKPAPKEHILVGRPAKTTA